jgi:hypothetical protein
MQFRPLQHDITSFQLALPLGNVLKEAFVDNTSANPPFDRLAALATQEHVILLITVSVKICTQVWIPHSELSSTNRRLDAMAKSSIKILISRAGMLQLSLK